MPRVEQQPDIRLVSMPNFVVGEDENSSKTSSNLDYVRQDKLADIKYMSAEQIMFHLVVYSSDPVLYAALIERRNSMPRPQLQDLAEW